MGENVKQIGIKTENAESTHTEGGGVLIFCAFEVLLSLSSLLAYVSTNRQNGKNTQPAEPNSSNDKFIVR